MKALQTSPYDRAFSLKNLAQGLLMGRIIPWDLHCSYSSFNSLFRTPERQYEWLLPLASSTSSLRSAPWLPDFSNQRLPM